MCIFIALRRPDHPWPLLIAANRDEMQDRPWHPPARHWPDRPELVAGIDELAGGSWLGVNDHGVCAAILNRPDSLGPAPGKRSRGELVLDALDHADAAGAAAALAKIEVNAYRGFNLIVADNRDAIWLRSQAPNGPGRVETIPLPAGLSVLTSHDRNDTASPRIRRYLPRFEAAPAPQPENGDWSAWEALLADRTPGSDEGPLADMTIVTDQGYGTCSSSLIALPAPGPGRPIWRFAAGPPHETPYKTVEL
ncbi:MAG: NRDE family protein [Alphaproteobacteria bacterium]